MASNPLDQLGGSSSNPIGGSGNGKSAAGVKTNNPLDTFDALSPGTAAQAGKTHTSPILKALSILDIPRAAVVSAIHEGADARFGGGNGAHLSDFVKQVQQHKGVGDYVHTGNPWLDRTLGFAGDVAADPLTYVSGGATVGAHGAELSAEGAARRLLSEEGTKALGEQGAKDAAARVLKARSASVLQSHELEAIGAKSGVQFAGHVVPGTEGLQRGLAATKGAVRAAAVEHVPGLDALGRKLTASPVLRDAAKTDPVGAFQVKEALRTVPVAARAERTQMLTELAKIEADHFGEGVDRAAVAKVMEGAATTEPKVQAAADALHGWFEKTANRAEELTGRVIPRRESYLPWVMTDEAKAGADAAGSSARRGGKQAFELRADLLGKDANWMGHDLTGSPAERRAQVEKIAQDRFGTKLLKDDPVELAQGYANGMQRYIKNYGQLKALEDAGLAVPTRMEEVVNKRAGSLRKGIANDLHDAVDQAQGFDLHDIADELAKARTAGAASPEELALRGGGTAASTAATAAGDAASTAGAEVDRLTQAVEALKGKITAAPVAADTSAVKAKLDEAVAKLGKATDEHAALTSEVQKVASGATSSAAAIPDAKVAQIDAMLQQFKEFAPKLDKVSRSMTADDAARTMVKLPDGSQHTVLNAVDAMSEKLRALDNLKHQITEGAPAPTVDPAHAKQLAAAEVKVTKARAVVAQHQAAFDVASVATAGISPAEHQSLTAELADMQSRLETAKGAQAERLSEQVSHAEKAKTLFEQADALRAAGHDNLSQIAMLEGMFQQAEVHQAQGLKDAVGLKALFDGVKSTKFAPADMLQDGLKELAANKWAEPWVVDAVNEVQKFLEPKAFPKWLRGVDWITSRWKAYNLLTPGFHARNLFGGLFNNELAGVDRTSYLHYARAWRAIRSEGVDALPEGATKEAFKAMFDHQEAFWNGGLAGEAVSSTDNGTAASRGLLGRLGVPEKIDPTSLNNAAISFSHGVGGDLHNHVRGVLFFDRFLKTGEVSDALDAVAKYHFDYSDLSQFEKTYMKRAIPFYTWSRKNFPLQLEMMAKRPGVYTTFLHAKQNIELGVPQDTVVPSYYGSLLGIRTPFKTNGGDRIYFTPDTPFRNLAETFDVNKLIGSLNPLLKVPLESAANKQFYTGIPFTGQPKPVPLAFLPVAEALRPLQGKFGLPKIMAGKGGQLYMSDKDAYKVESMLPFLGKLRRAAPSEKRFQDRALTTWLSYMGGLGARTLSQSEIDGELRRRAAQSKQKSKVAKALGYG